MTSKLDQLRDMTVVVADTGDVEAVRRLKPQDCTTNPSLVLKAAGSDYFATTVDETIRSQSGAEPSDVATALTVAVGAELAGIVPGRVSTEVDASARVVADKALRQHFSTARSTGRARVAPESWTHARSMRTQNASRSRSITASPRCFTAPVFARSLVAVTIDR